MKRLRTTRVKNPSYHKGNLREKLLREAARLISRDGLRGVSMRKLGRRLGISRTAAYHHFANKDDLLAAVGQNGYRRLLERVQAAASTNSPPLERLRAALISYVRFALEETEYFRLMFANLLDRPLHMESVEELRPIAFSSREAFDAYSVLLSAVKQCQSEDVFRPGDPLVITDTLHGFIHGVARLAADNHLKSDLEQILNQGVDSLLRGLSAGCR